MTTIVEGRINDRWSVGLTGDRAAFHAARPTWEAGRLAHMAERVEPGMVVYDVGAECGDFTALYRIWTGVEGTVVPIEPKPEMWPSIKHHWDANTAGAPAAWWPGFASGRTRRDLDALARVGWPTDVWPTYADRRVRIDPGFRHLRDENAPEIRLDDLAVVTGIVPDVVVVDVEGAEWNVLDGARELLASAAPIFYVSVHDVGDESWPGALGGWYGKSALDLLDLVTEYGYVGTELPYHGEGERFFVYEPGS